MRRWVARPCVYYGYKVDSSFVQNNLDIGAEDCHVVAVSRGSLSVPPRLALGCSHCNGAEQGLRAALPPCLLTVAVRQCRLHGCIASTPRGRVCEHRWGWFKHHGCRCGGAIVSWWPSWLETAWWQGLPKGFAHMKIFNGQASGQR